MKYRLKKEYKVDETIIYVIERQLMDSSVWVYVEKTYTHDLALAQKLLANIKAGHTVREEILEEFDSEQV